MKIEIVAAGKPDAQELASIFLEYRNGSISPHQPKTILECRTWIEERCFENSGIFFMAKSDDQIVGFAILYPGYNSISLRKHWVLGDLFVVPGHRNMGIASKIMARVHEHAENTNVEYVTLETAKTNINAQKLYEKLGYKQGTLYKQYYWYLGSTL